ncbi:hypothetical protein BC828DRAFT_365028 [Blastocladiella britannica]|nr:hypothetical protein BC828DRAFT_365028 [Blastocladiella britannica]
MSTQQSRTASLAATAFGLARAVSAAALLPAVSSSTGNSMVSFSSGTHESAPPLTRETFWLTIALILFLVLLGGLFAGLTLGLLSLDLMSLEVLEQSGSAKEKRYAALIKPIRKQGHWLLVTLLLSNVIVNETLPILTDSVWSGGWPAVVISSTLIVIFGEVIPQAVCSRYGLAIGANCAWFVRLLMLLLSPIGYPMSKLLDWILGEAEGTTYKRAELKALVSLHEQSEQHFGPLSQDEVTIIKAVLDLRDKYVVDIMTPLEHVYMLNWDQVLDPAKMEEVAGFGHSRIPVYAGVDRRNIIGMLLVKALLTYDPRERKMVKDFLHLIHSVPALEPNAACFDVLNLFQEGRSHLAVIIDDDPRLIQAASFANVDPYSRPILNVLGIVTLEDVIEELLGEEIVDETDLYVDMRKQDLVRRFKSPKAGPSLTPRLGPMPSPHMAAMGNSRGGTGPGNLRRTASASAAAGYGATLTVEDAERPPPVPVVPSSMSSLAPVASSSLLGATTAGPPIARRGTGSGALVAVAALASSSSGSNSGGSSRVDGRKRTRTAGSAARAVQSPSYRSDDGEKQPLLPGTASDEQP